MKIYKGKREYLLNGTALICGGEYWDWPIHRKIWSVIPYYWAYIIAVRAYLRRKLHCVESDEQSREHARFCFNLCRDQARPIYWIPEKKQ